jgi:hypothetical protein
LVFIDGPVQGAANLFSWEDAQRFMQPPLPHFSSFEAAVAESKHDFDGAWGDDLQSFVRARIVPDGGGWILTLTAPVRLELLRGLFDSQVDALWPRVGVPAVALLARRGPAMISAAREQGVARLAEAAPRVQVVWFDTPHDIPIFQPAEVALEVERISSLAADRDSSEAAAG